MQDPNRTPDPNNPNIVFVRRVINGGFEELKEVTSTTGETPVNGNDFITEETITVTRYIGNRTNNFPTP